MMQWAMGDQPLMRKVQVDDKSMMTLTSMEVFTIILPAFTNGKTEPKDTIFLVNRMELLAVMKLNYSNQGPARQRIVILLLTDDSWRYRGENNDMYQTEHDELFASIRSGKPFNDGEKGAHSSMVAILGRMVAYTGQRITYQQALNSKEDLTPLILIGTKLGVPAPLPQG